MDVWGGHITRYGDGLTHGGLNGVLRLEKMLVGTSNYAG